MHVRLVSGEIFGVSESVATCRDCGLPLDMTSPETFTSHTCWRREHREAVEQFQSAVVEALHLRQICEWLVHVLDRAKKR
jgi:hypothetical protein